MLINDVGDCTINLTLDPASAGLLVQALEWACDKDVAPQLSAAWGALASALEVAGFAATMCNHPKLGEPGTSFSLARYKDGKITVDVA